MKAVKRILPAMAVLSLLLLAGLGALHAKSMSNGAPALNCAQCHPGSQNRPVKFVIEGLPSNGKYEPGKTYKITIKITEGPKCNPSVACGGFAFYASAGKLIITDKKDTFIANAGGKTIVTHTKDGSKKREWTFEWQAPTKPEKVTIIVSVLAANGDGSFNGDAFAQKTIVLEPATGGAATTTSKPSPTTTVITTTTVKTTTTTSVVTTTVGYETTHNTGVAVGVAILIFLVVVGGYLLYARK